MLPRGQEREEDLVMLSLVEMVLDTYLIPTLSK